MIVSCAGFLRDLLEAFTSVPVGVATCDHTHSIGTQTEKEGGRDRAPATLEERLRSLDEHHMTQLEKEVVVKGDWKIEYENQLKKEMNREMEEFKYIHTLIYPYCIYRHGVVCLCIGNMNYQRLKKRKDYIMK